MSDDQFHVDTPRFGNAIRLTVNELGTATMSPDRARKLAGALLEQADGVDGEGILIEAHEMAEDRSSKYGPPGPNMRAAARLWSAYLRNTPGWSPEADPLDGADVAQMMILLKMARHQTGETNRDTFVDEAGYARVAAEVLGVDRR